MAIPNIKEKTGKISLSKNTKCGIHVPYRGPPGPPKLTSTKFKLLLPCSGKEKYSS